MCMYKCMYVHVCIHYTVHMYVYVCMYDRIFEEGLYLIIIMRYLTKKHIDFSTYVLRCTALYVQLVMKCSCVTLQTAQSKSFDITLESLLNNMCLLQGYFVEFALRNFAEKLN